MFNDSNRIGISRMTLSFRSGFRSFVFGVAWAVSLLQTLPLQSGETPQHIILDVDATAITRNLLRAKFAIPVQAGDLTLAYPKWIQGEHGPTGPVVDLVGVKFLVDEKPIRWRRDDYDAHAFHLTIPAGVTALTGEVEFLLPSEKSGFSRSASTTKALGVVNWNQLVLHPVGQPIAEQMVSASLTLPSGWKAGTALSPVKTTDNRIDYEPVSVETLCDSPVNLGQHYRELAIGPTGKPAHTLCVVADDPASLDVSAEMKQALDQIVTETHAVFGEPPYRSYRFLVTLSDHIGHYGMEHHESSDNRGPEGMLTDPLYRKTWHGWLLCHEFVHAWNGKYRRPAGMAHSDHQQPLQTDLLWIYEGLTQYYGLVLAARSGIWQPEIARDNFARIAARADDETGREWRSLEDTAIAAHYQFRAARPDGWYRRRGTDFYDEAAMVWLEADAIIRTQSDGTKSLDDFCKVFYAGGNLTPRVAPYRFEDVVETLQQVQPYDWEKFFDIRVKLPGAPSLSRGVEQSGWRLIYQKAPTELYSANESDTGKIDLSSTLGLILLEDGTVEDVAPKSAAAVAGISSGMKLVAVNNRRWTPEVIQKSVAKTEDGKVTLLFEKQDFFQTHVLSYDGGARFPTLERIEGQPDVLSQILAPKSPARGNSKD
jgi:predicted metalloprotease with PDZ domain